VADRVPVSDRVPGVSGHTPSATVSPCPSPQRGDTLDSGHDRGTKPQSGVSVSLPGVGPALANAIRQVNTAYSRIPAAARPEPAATDPLEDEINAACLAGDRDRALAAIRAWRGYWVREFIGPTTSAGR
jgi:hypothetical protein